MSRVVVFVGPTLSEAEVRGVLPEADVRPPVEQGDVLDAALDPDCRILGIVDGYFERVPSVWHKEILWAMARGVHVLGAASMGALRAAELHAFGMEGVGEIFEAFRDGDLDADDVVAVAHAPAEHGYRAASVALVDVRATLGAALHAGLVSTELRDTVVLAAKGLLYPDRTYARILDDARALGAPATELEVFAAFCRTAPIEQKRLDAIELLETIRARAAADLAPNVVGYALERSSYFERLLAEVTDRRARRAAPPKSRTTARSTPSSASSRSGGSGSTPSLARWRSGRGRPRRPERAPPTSSPCWRPPRRTGASGACTRRMRSRPSSRGRTSRTRTCPG